MINQCLESDRLFMDNWNPDRDALEAFESYSDPAMIWQLRRTCWGKVYATEAAKIIVNYSFNILNLATLYATIHPENHRSVAVTQRLGMTNLGLCDRYYNCQLLLFALQKP
ncbi:GNAT family N-acetyltransferase [Roseofilum reptotaenium CS-1145]|uniref:N-acetyltransferase domain-containing protein n=1 Tax=Roseofilum reptotaenium AO1-A TaxID=1925591 RepID=A0A1L9QT50_9CYAN|nr:MULTISPECIES: GNAT family N-acetyltransferase [Roseofilum]MBP0028911.1 GNAT family N-acetyltransferase [Roseofilum sp. Guam]MDB9518206.1 GNAT family N-acetyltransferase [Roseofilum reptotaenium CS-1145]OJJ25796.1 hypothetical protein BI308_09775 [Roseofilum reptotaenium AO1-A]